jgi:hypothetical protein
MMTVAGFKKSLLTLEQAMQMLLAQKRRKLQGRTACRGVGAAGQQQKSQYLGIIAPICTAAALASC